MSWISLVLEVPAAEAEALSDALMAHGALSVSVEDAAAGTADEKPLFGEPGSPTDTMWDRSVIRALCPADASANNLIVRASTDCGLPPPPYRAEVVAEQ